jgi:cysteine protease ATG4
MLMFASAEKNSNCCDYSCTGDVADDDNLSGGEELRAINKGKGKGGRNESRVAAGPLTQGQSGSVDKRTGDNSDNDDADVDEGEDYIGMNYLDQSSFSRHHHSTSSPIHLRATPTFEKDSPHQALTGRSAETHQLHSLEMSRYMYLLGRSYHLSEDVAARQADEESLLYFSYRNEFSELSPYGYTSDAGWGCMLRASQMLLAQALKVHYRGRNWTNFARGYGTSYLDPFATTASAGGGLCSCSIGQRSPNNQCASGYRRQQCKLHSNHKKARQDEKFYADLLTWFADHPGMDTCFSLHNMVAVGFKFEKLPGEWYGPGTACYVLRELCHIYEQNQHRKRYKQILLMQQLSDSSNNSSSQSETPDREYPPSFFANDVADADIFRVVVAQEGCVCRDAIELAMTREGRQRDEVLKGGFLPRQDAAETLVEEKSDDIRRKSTSETTQAKDLLLDPLLNPECDDSKQNVYADATATLANITEPLKWDRPMLLMIPLRLGLTRFNKDVYAGPLARTLGLSQSVGFLGGSPRHALWYYGANVNGSNVYGLDPHTVQPAPRREASRYGVVELSHEYQASVICSNPVEMDIGRIDPSVALGFYCRDCADLESLLSSIQKFRREGEAELFSVMDTSPDYEATGEMFLKGDELLGTSIGTLSQDENAASRSLCVADSFADSQKESCEDQCIAPPKATTISSDENNGEDEDDDFVFL